MNKVDLKIRTKKFALDVIRSLVDLPQQPEYWVIKKQLIRCATSVGANYRSACMGKSKSDFIAKLSIVAEEADESIYWIELLEELLQEDNIELIRLKDESTQLLKIFISSLKTSRSK